MNIVLGIVGWLAFRLVAYDVRRLDRLLDCGVHSHRHWTGHPTTCVIAPRRGEPGGAAHCAAQLASFSQCCLAPGRSLLNSVRKHLARNYSHWVNCPGLRA